MMTKIFLRKEEKKKICPRKASVIDLLNILDNDLWRAGYGRFVWCFCICCMHWVIHKVSRAIAKRKEHSLSFPEYLKYTKRKSNEKVNILFGGGGGRGGGGVRKLLYSWLSLSSLLFRDICFFPANNFNITKRFFSTSFSCFTNLQIVFFLDWSFSRLQHRWMWFDSFPVWYCLDHWWECNFCNVNYCRILYFFSL